jgi:hypothetical protein
MDWNAQIGKDLRALDGIVATLLSLAGLAEKAARAPFPVRWLVLWFVRLAETVAQDFVAGSTEGAALLAWSPSRTTPPHGSSPADAIDLALSLSGLAHAVAKLATQLRRHAFLHGSPASGGKSLHPLRRNLVPGATGVTVPQFGRLDTS